MSSTDQTTSSNPSSGSLVNCRYEQFRAGMYIFHCLQYISIARRNLDPSIVESLRTTGELLYGEKYGPYEDDVTSRKSVCEKRARHYLIRAIEVLLSLDMAGFAKHLMNKHNHLFLVQIMIQDRVVVTKLKNASSTVPKKHMEPAPGNQATKECPEEGWEMVGIEAVTEQVNAGVTSPAGERDTSCIVQ